jgi:hypothetical protein
MFLRAFALRGGLRSRVHSLLRLSQRWLKVNSHDQKMSICVAGISRRTRTNAGQPRAHLRPEKPGRERPPSIRGRGQVCASRGGSLTPRLRSPASARDLRRHPSAADVSEIEHAHVHGAEWVGVALLARRPRQGRRGRPDRGHVEGGQVRFSRLSPLLSPCSLAEALVLTRIRAATNWREVVAATRGGTA